MAVQDDTGTEKREDGHLVRKDEAPNRSTERAPQTTRQGLYGKDQDYDEIDSLLFPQSRNKHGGSNEIMGLKAFLKTDPPPDTVIGRALYQNDDVPSETSSLSDVPNPSADVDRKSPYSLRPSTSEFFRSGLASLKPKVKLFARPVTDDKAQKVTGPMPTRQKLPPGMRPKFAKGEESRPKTSKSGKPTSMAAAQISPRPASGPIRTNKSPPPPFPPSLQSKAIALNGAAVSPTSPSPTALPSMPSPLPQSPAKAKSRGAATFTSDEVRPEGQGHAAMKTDVMSPEKQRLLKALQMRRNQASGTQEGGVQGLQGKNSKMTNPLELNSTLKKDSGVAMDRFQDKEKRPGILPLRDFEQRSLPLSSTQDSGRSSEASRADQRPQTNERTESASNDSTLTLRTAPSQQQSPVNKDKELPALPKRLSVASKDDNYMTELKKHSRHPSRASNPRTSLRPLADSETGSEPDEAFLEELRTAKFEQARSLSISPPPSIGLRTPTHGRDGSSGMRSVASRLHDSPATASPKIEIPEPRKAEANDGSTPAKKGSDKANVSKRINVSSGISKRIQALAEMSERDYRFQPGSELALSPPLSSDGMSARGVSRPSTSFRNGALHSRPSSPARSTSRSVPRASSFDSQRSTGTQRASSRGTKRDSMSVTAHTLQPSAIEEESADVDDAAQKVGFKEPRFERLGHPSYFRRKNPSNSSISVRPSSRDSSRTTFTRHSLEAFRPMSRRNNEGKSRPGTSFSNASLERVDEGSEPRSSRASKLFKRMSISGAGMRHSQDANPEPMRHEGNKSTFSNKKRKPTGVVVGDLNVQLPDSLVRALSCQLLVLIRLLIGDLLSCGSEDGSTLTEQVTWCCAPFSRAK